MSRPAHGVGRIEARFGLPEETGATTAGITERGFGDGSDQAEEDAEGVFGLEAGTDRTLLISCCLTSGALGYRRGWWVTGWATRTWALVAARGARVNSAAGRCGTEGTPRRTHPRGMGTGGGFRFLVLDQAKIVVNSKA